MPLNLRGNECPPALVSAPAKWFGVLMDFNIACKITPGMELFEQQYFTEQYIILTRTEEGHARRIKLT